MTTATAEARTTSAARIEANRKNAQKSTGPRSQAGKERSRFNALKHGMRAELPVLPGEDEEILRRRHDSWTATLQPRDEVERYLVERAVNVSWQLDRADRAWAARMTLDILESGNARADAQADEVIRLGRRLFWDPRGPLCLYPFYPAGLGDAVRVSWSPEVVDSNDPARLLEALEATAMGCAWLLDRWNDLGALLEDGLLWQPHDRFRAIRLLGRQPFDATDDDRVMAIYLACHDMDPGKEQPFADVHVELGAGERIRFDERIEARSGRLAAPAGPDAAREWLLALVAEQVDRLEVLLAAHLRREEAATEARRGFEDSEAGEKLRRYQLANNRTLLRILEILRKRQREADRAATGSEGRGATGSEERGTRGGERVIHEPAETFRSVREGAAPSDPGPAARTEPRPPRNQAASSGSCPRDRKAASDGAGAIALPAPPPEAQAPTSVVASDVTAGSAPAGERPRVSNDLDHLRAALETLAGPAPNVRRPSRPLAGRRLPRRPRAHPAFVRPPAAGPASIPADPAPPEARTGLTAAIEMVLARVAAVAKPRNPTNEPNAAGAESQNGTNEPNAAIAKSQNVTNEPNAPAGERRTAANRTSAPDCTGARWPFRPLVLLLALAIPVVLTTQAAEPGANEPKVVRTPSSAFRFEYRPGDPATSVAGSSCVGRAVQANRRCQSPGPHAAGEGPGD